MFLPQKTETLVLPSSSQEMLQRLERVVYTAEDKLNDVEEDELHVFTGTIFQNAFVISLKLKRPDNFIPIINGNIEDTSKGSIVFLKYRLFKSTKMFLLFWTAVIFILALLLILFQGKVWFAVIAILASIANYLVTVVNFNRKVKQSREYLMDVLTVDAAV